MSAAIDRFTREIRTIKIVASRELAVQVQYRNKFLIDVFSHILGIAPIILITIAMSGSSLDGEGLTDATVVRTAFVLLGFIAFLAFGFGTPIMLYTGMGWGISNEVTSGTLERNFLAPVSRPGIILGFGMYYVGLYLFHVVTLLLLAVLFIGDEITFTGPGIWPAAASVGALLMLSVGMGLFSAGVYLLVRDSSFFQILVHRPFMMLSGAIFVIDLLPQPIEFLAKINPLTYGVDAFRSSLSANTSLLDPWVEVGIVFGSALALIVTGAWFFKKVVRRQMQTGELVQF